MITIKRSTAIGAVALIGVLGGLALGQITQALSAGSQPKASASYVSPLERDVHQMSHDLKAIRHNLGEDYLGTTAISFLDEIGGNTYAICGNSGGSAFCHNSP